MTQVLTIQHDEGNPEDIDTDAEEHALDDLRYGVMSRPWQPAGKGFTANPLHQGRAVPTINDLIARTKQNLKKKAHKL